MSIIWSPFLPPPPNVRIKIITKFFNSPETKIIYGAAFSSKNIIQFRDVKIFYFSNFMPNILVNSFLFVQSLQRCECEQLNAYTCTPPPNQSTFPSRCFSIDAATQKCILPPMVVARTFYKWFAVSSSRIWCVVGKQTGRFESTDSSF